MRWTWCHCPSVANALMLLLLLTPAAISAQQILQQAPLQPVQQPSQLPSFGGICPDASSLPRAPNSCTLLRRVCVDQGVFVLYEPSANPRHELFSGRLPQLHLSGVKLDFYGYGDAWGTAFEHPPPRLRPATAGEETRELAHPQFSRCALPLIIYADRLYSQAAFFAHVVARIHTLQQSGALDKRLTFAVSADGMRLRPFHSFWLEPFSPFPTTTFSTLSSRLPFETPERYTPDGQHGRCYWNLLACQFGAVHTAAAGAVAAAAGGLDAPLWRTGQAILEHHRERLPPIDPEFADTSKLRVLIGVLPRHSQLRTIVNQDQVWSWCTKFKPPAGVTAWNGTACLLHEFGRDLLADAAYTSQADVLMGVHSDTLINGYYMRRGSSVVELRPLNHSGPAANALMREMTARDKDSLFWWGVSVVNPAHSAPGQMELQHRGAPEAWAQQRHTFVRLMALQYLLERIALTRTDLTRYNIFRSKQENYITDGLEKLGPDARRSLHRALLHVGVQGSRPCSKLLTRRLHAAPLELTPLEQLQMQPPLLQEQRPNMGAPWPLLLVKECRQLWERWRARLWRRRSVLKFAE